MNGQITANKQMCFSSEKAEKRIAVPALFIFHFHSKKSAKNLEMCDICVTHTSYRR